MQVYYFIIVTFLPNGVKTILSHITEDATVQDDNALSLGHIQLPVDANDREQIVHKLIIYCFIRILWSYELIYFVFIASVWMQVR